MSNLSITLRCDRACSYCFAQKAEAGAIAGNTDMSTQTFSDCLSFLERSGIDQLRLLGGEPTLHPAFPSLVREARSKGFGMLVFSSGIVNEAALQCLADIPPPELTVLVNVNSPGERLPGETEAQAATFSALGERAQVGFNIHTPTPDLGFLEQLIVEFGLARRIRLGLAHPRIDGRNVTLHPKHYRAVGAIIADFARHVCSQGITFDFDCGFVSCMFPDRVSELPNLDVSTIGTRCNFLPDILPKGMIVPCYPLSPVWQRPLEDADTRDRVEEECEARLAPYREIGIFRECSRCGRRANGSCTGGCLAAAMRRLRPGPPTAPSKRTRVSSPRKPCSRKMSVPGKETWSVPYVDQPLSFWSQLHERFGDRIRHIYFPLPSEAGFASARPPQPSQHLDDVLAKSPFELSVLINPVTLSSPIEEVAPAVVDALCRLHGDFGICDATISSLPLARCVREALPCFSLSASVVMDIATPPQAMMLKDVFDVLVPGNRVLRRKHALSALRSAFPGRIRLIVNEACLSGCPFRVQHFQDIAAGTRIPRSLCRKTLEQYPWMRLTSSWILPQHLHLYDGLYDELKLAGRVTLQDPAHYVRVCDAYLNRRTLLPNEIGGGPTSVLHPIDITEDFFAHTLECDLQCHACTRCRDYWETALHALT